MLGSSDRAARSHKYQQLPLISVDDFLVQRPDLVNADENALMIARIEHELAEREALESERQGLLKKKQGLIADNKKRKDDLASLDKDLETFIDVSLRIAFLCLLTLTAGRLQNRFKRYLKKKCRRIQRNRHIEDTLDSEYGP